jgi:predicted enzyme related to lactoylglutathione lyase
MPERDGYAPGTPSWVDLATPDLDDAKRFYRELFGWEATDAGDPEQTGGYAMFTCGGRVVAGVGPVTQEGQWSAWTTYFATDDADALAERVKAAGGTALVEPMDVMQAGRMALFAHPAAGFFGAWQAGEHKGAQLVNEPVSLAWNTLVTRDREGATKLLESAFGLRAAEQDFGGGPTTILMLGEDGVAGLMDPVPGMPESVPAFWGVTFAVTDADATLARAVQLGANETVAPIDMAGVGRLAGVADPWGAQFNFIAL